MMMVWGGNDYDLDASDASYGDHGDLMRSSPLVMIVTLEMRDCGCLWVMVGVIATSMVLMIWR